MENWGHGKLEKGERVRRGLLPAWVCRVNDNASCKIYPGYRW